MGKPGEIKPRSILKDKIPITESVSAVSELHTDGINFQSM